ncbi:hypothetical protein LEP1GSC188_3017 [Leptospira weilii serovar Topaz str. LT2116]|uniref:Uncharacterized protein n=1 Tax=Leptospira weilii serovar Topaz str. LT2116 TaxID=1088540 RepID=M3H254_9LEPT|nr:hypothetical protein LEP1GSC188_3017 [Leptospira weilii serovar Topaz str. LT2116]
MKSILTFQEIFAGSNLLFQHPIRHEFSSIPFTMIRNFRFIKGERGFLAAAQPIQDLTKLVFFVWTA